MARGRTRSAIDQQIAVLKIERDQLVRREQAKVGRCAERAGLLELELPDDVLLQAFKDIVAGFRAQTQDTPPARKAAARAPAREVAHVD
jgi:TraC-like protein